MDGNNIGKRKKRKSFEEELERYESMLSYVRWCLKNYMDPKEKFNEFRNELILAPKYIQDTLNYKSDGERMEL